MKTKLKILGVVIILLSPAITNSQNLESHRWQNRIVLILTDDIDSRKYSTQIEEFKKHLEGIEERKIVVYHIGPERFKLGLQSEAEWQVAETQFNLYKKTDEEIELVLLGLDGGVKLRAVDFLSCKQLFKTIDAMPMRMQEMRRKNNGSKSGPN